tara:strand:- start:53 stop:1042 length:990 start_codon:yes stop_codon:yes gene_type:complete
MLINIDKLTDQWASQKYSIVFEKNKILDVKLASLAKNCFAEMGINDLYMNGESVESLPRNSSSENLNGPKFSDAFHELGNNNILSPANYLLKIINNYESSNLNRELIVGYLSRALRSFASFLREPDLAYKLKNLLIKDDPSVSVDMNPEQDIKGHVDILLTYKKFVFNLWSYQATSRGLPNTIDRLRGNRGEVLEGINILCPLKTEDAQVLVKRGNSLRKKRERINKWKIELDQNPSISRKKQLESLILKNTKQADELRDEIKENYEILSKEVIIKNGWFLHSENYINLIRKEIESSIANNSEIISYIELKKILSGPFKFTKEINAFKK